jgi:hypothetical protein
MQWGPYNSIKAIMVYHASRYERVAIAARANPAQARLGYLVAGTFMMLGILDALSTNLALEAGAYEVNGFMRWLQEVLGPFWVVPKLMLQALVAAMIVWSPNRPTIFIMVLTSAWIASVVMTNFILATVL